MIPESAGAAWVARVLIDHSQLSHIDVAASSVPGLTSLRVG